MEALKLKKDRRTGKTAKTFFFKTNISALCLLKLCLKLVVVDWLKQTSATKN